MLRFIKFCSLGLLFLVALVLVNALTHNPENEELENKTTFEINEDRAITNLIPRNSTHLNLQTSHLPHGCQF